LDILVNNAGIGRFAPVKELSLSDFDAMWNVNVRGLFLCTQHAVRMMETQRGGVIVNISSLAGKNAFVRGAGYAATKWALMGFAKCLMLEVRERNIRVVTVCPGSVDTTFSHPSESPRAEKLIHPQDVADTVLAAITIPARSMVSEIDIRPTNPK
jgi:NADP-dependent 3-hydroxy acid dehydrogenase YdfG